MGDDNATILTKADAIINLAFDTAIGAALAASEVILPFWPNPLNGSFDDRVALESIEKEGNGNYATIADIRSEKKIIEVIQSKRTLEHHSILSEESDEIRGDDEWQWIVDPVDGTVNFRSGNPDFGICIALFNGNEPVVGLIAMPGLRQMVVVKSGSDAKLLTYGRKEIADLSLLAQNHREPLHNALIGYDVGYTARTEQMNYVAKRIVENVGYASCLASFSTGNFRLLQGMMGVYFGMTPTAMDVAPAAALVPAVGEVVTDMAGMPIDWSAPSRSYIGAVNRQLHDQFLAFRRNELTASSNRVHRSDNTLRIMFI